MIFLIAFIILAILFLVYVYIVRKNTQKLTLLCLVWRAKAEQYSKELATLTEQYRQLAKINQAFMSTKKTIKLKEVK